MQIDTDLLLIITSTADELSRGTNINDLEPQNSDRDAYFNSELHRKKLETDQDNLSMKFSALNIHFYSLDALGLNSMGASNLGIPFKMR